MKKPTDFYICTNCYIVSKHHSQCDCFLEEDEIPYINWNRYLFLDPSLPLIPEEGKKYPLSEKLLLSRECVIKAVALTLNDLDHFFSSNSEIITAGSLSM